jgi:hypothetical protein
VKSFNLAFARPERQFLLPVVRFRLMPCHSHAGSQEERGSIAEQGTHAERVARTGLQYALWQQQVGEGSLVERAPA